MIPKAAYLANLYLSALKKAPVFAAGFFGGCSYVGILVGLRLIEP